MQGPINPNPPGIKSYQSFAPQKTAHAVDVPPPENIVQYLLQQSQRSFLEKMVPFLQSLQITQDWKGLQTITKPMTAQSVQAMIHENTKSCSLSAEFEALKQMLSLLIQTHPQDKAELTSLLNQLKAMKGSLPHLDAKQMEQLTTIWTTVAKLIPQKPDRQYAAAMLHLFAALRGTLQGAKKTCDTLTDQSENQTDATKTALTDMQELLYLFTQIEGGKKLSPEQLTQLISILQHLQTQTSKLSPTQARALESFMDSLFPGKKKKKLDPQDIQNLLAQLLANSSAPLDALKRAKRELEESLTDLRQVQSGSEEAKRHVEMLKKTLDMGVDMANRTALGATDSRGASLFRTPPAQSGATPNADESDGSGKSGGLGAAAPGSGDGGDNSNIGTNLDNTLFHYVEPYFMEQFIMYGDILYGDEMGAGAINSVMSTISQSALGSFADAASHFAFSNLLGKSSNGEYAGSSVSAQKALANEKQSIADDMAAIKKLLGGLTDSGYSADSNLCPKITAILNDNTLSSTQKMAKISALLGGKEGADGSLLKLMQNALNNPQIPPDAVVGLLKKLASYGTNMQHALTNLTSLQDVVDKMQVVPGSDADHFKINYSESDDWTTELPQLETNVIDGQSGDPDSGLVSINTQISGDSADYANVSTTDQMNVQKISMEYQQNWTAIGTTMQSYNQMMQTIASGINPR